MGTSRCREAPYLSSEGVFQKQMSGRGIHPVHANLVRAKLVFRRKQKRYLKVYQELQAAARKAKDLRLEVRRLKQRTRRAAQRVANAKAAVRQRDLARGDGA